MERSRSSKPQSGWELAKLHKIEVSKEEKQFIVNLAALQRKDYMPIATLLAFVPGSLLLPAQETTTNIKNVPIATR